MKYYYTDDQNKPTGPVELEQLRQLHAQGIIKPQTSVIPEGATQWTTYGVILWGATPSPATTPPAPTSVPAAATVQPAASAPAAATPPPASAPEPTVAATPAPPSGPKVSIFEQVSTLLADLVGLLLQVMRTVLTENLLRLILTFFARGGILVVLAGAAIGLIQSIVVGVRGGTFASVVSSLGSGLVVAGAVVVLQYVAFRFFAANDTLVKNNPSRVGSTAFLDCMALMLLVGAFSAAVGGLFASIAFVSIAPLIPGVILAAVLLFGAGIALNPQLCNVQTEESSAGEEAIGLASFFGKVSLVVQPALFGVLALGGTLAICLSFFNDSAADTITSALSSIPVAGALASTGGAAFLVVACVLPVLAYLGFLVLYLHLDLLRAILGLPRQLDRLGHKPDKNA